MEKINELNGFIKEYKNKYITYRFITMFTHSYLLSPALMFLYFFGINFFLCIGISLLFAAINRYIYVRSKHDWILSYNLFKVFEVCRENELNMIFK